MKKLIVYYTDIWMKKLLTMDRFEQIEYFIDDDLKNSVMYGKKVFPFEQIKKEKINSFVVIVADSHKYGMAKKRLEEIGLKENIDFFNGWKIDINFYKSISADGYWNEYEEKNNINYGRDVWKKRAKTMVSLIPNTVCSVMDLGCGEGIVREFLDERIRYYGVDYCKRTDDTYIRDLNNDKIPEIDVDLYYMGGLVYYLKDLNCFVKQLIGAKYILMSYLGTERYLKLDARTEEEYMGVYCCKLTTFELLNIMIENGFLLKKTYWDPMEFDEPLFLFENTMRD